MSGATATFFRYQLPLTRPFVLRQQSMCERIGLLVRLRTSAGATAWGEIAPLPVFSREALDEALRQALDVAAVLVRRDLDQADPHLIGLRRQENIYGSVRFGLESALAGLQAVHAGTHPATLLAETPPQSVHANALLTGVGTEVIDEALALAERGYTAIKLKVGRMIIRDEAATVRDLRAELPPQVAIRLDANRAWSFDDARAFASAAKPESFAYIEEPLSNPGQLPELTARSGIAYAVDETLQDLGWRIAASLREHGEDAMDHYPSYPDSSLAHAALGAVAWIVKPTLLGAPLEFLSDTAPRGGYSGPVVVSSSFESGLGLAMLAQLAATANRDTIAAGLDTQRWIAADTLEEDLLNVDGTCDLQRAWELAQHPRMDRLEEIAHV
ncbi:MAG: o-succinylbenzoate synthase [Candidatus Hydrogenedentes bacterium]|nr:o-succinylbenzoate synthase [Candidatus Hydrogenedentota bacterium]